MKLPRIVHFSALLLSIFNASYAACPAPGSGIVVSGTTATESGCAITTTSIPALQANLSGTINFSNGSAMTTGGGAYGAYANGTGSTINLDDVFITTASANGLFLNSGQITFITGNVITTGASTNGAQLLGTNALLTLNNVGIQTNGTSGIGLFVQLGGNVVNATNCIISTTANGGRGVDVGLGAGAASSANINNCIINTAQGVGPPSFGAVVARNGSNIVIGNSTINSEVYGVHSIDGGASIIVDNSTINITANAAVFGAYAQNNTTITLQNDTHVTTTGGNNAHGFVIQDGSTGNLFDGSITTSGTNAQGIFMIGFTADNQVNIVNSTVATNGAGASAITVFGNTGRTNTLQAESATFSAANDDLISIAGGIANINFSDVTAHAAADHLLLLVDGSNPATLNWVTDISSLAGNMQVISGNIGNVTLNNSTWTGAALDVTNMTVNDSDWNLTANSTITNQLINHGFIDFVSDGDNFKTLTVSGGYIGQNGIMGLNTFLGSDGSPSDLLIINGNSASGATQLEIKNTTGPGELTVANGILVVDAINGGTTAPNSFTLANLVIAGPYEYTLVRGSVDESGPDNWYLRSTYEPPTPPVPPEPPIPPIPNYRREVSLYTALPSTALLYGRTLLDTLYQRVGDEFQHCGCECGSEECSFFKNFWSRVITSNGKQHGGDIFHHGPNFKFHFLTFQTGVDVYRRVRWDGSRDHIGVLGAVGRGRSSVRHFTHVNAGTNRFDAYTAGLYWTHFGSSGWYIDNVFETNWYENMKANSRRIRPLKTHGIEFAGSIEGGYIWKLKYLTLEPQAQIVYQNLSLHDTQEAVARVDFHRTNSVLGRLGIRIANTWCRGGLYSERIRKLTTWFRADIWHDFEGKSKTFFSSEDGPIGFASDLGGSWFEGTVGVDAQVNDIFSFYGSFNGDVYLNGRGYSYNGIAGIRANF